MRLLIVGYSQPGHMGNYLGAAATQLGIEYELADAARAEARSRAVRTFCWHLRDKRPARLHRFGDEVVDICNATQRNVVIATGRVALDKLHIEHLRGLGIRVINYSCDDPWNHTQ